jgi:hypothetical protein
LIKLNGLRKVTYVGTENKIRTIIGDVTINNDIISIIPKNNAAGEITLFKERIIQIERVNND